MLEVLFQGTLDIFPERDNFGYFFRFQVKEFRKIFEVGNTGVIIVKGTLGKFSPSLFLDHLFYLETSTQVEIIELLLKHLQILLASLG